ncbi:hypothetical protein [Asanoa iriomotensis]|nr:hypothetical protein [Asanoa iriomotensis]
MGVRRERGMSAEPEVVYNTATDPARSPGWLPERLHRVRAAMAPGLAATWRDGVWLASLVVEDEPAGGAVAVLEVSAAGVGDSQLGAVAERALFELDREVADNLTPG